MSRLYSRQMLSAFLIFSVVGQAAQATQQPRDFSTYSPRVEPVRIETAEAPEIDGELDDDAWRKAATLTEFYQIEPVTGATPSEETIVYLTFDENALYVAIKAYDQNPSSIKRTIMERDGDVWRDDMVRFYIDPFDTGLSGFGFDVNALGARADRLVQANRRPIDEWDTIWDSAASITDEGWQAEFSIPFRSIGFAPDLPNGWGVMITRELAHKNEEIRWAGIDRSVNKFGFARPGRILGIENVNQGNGLEVELLGALELSRDWERPRDDDIRFNPSANIYYKFTPSLTGLLAFNADFSDAPLDSNEVNTGQFSIFRPETRDFFLQDAAFFEFGGDAFTRGQNGRSAAPNGRPFFSRRIGLVNGSPVTLEAGAKLSGDISGVKLGVLTTKMASTGDGDGELLTVARGTIDVLDVSRVGIIATHGDPSGLSDNSLVGVDFLFQNPSFMGKGLLQSDVYFQRSFSSTTADEDNSYGARVVYPNDRWDIRAEYRHIGDGFTPALGFVNRRGVDDYSVFWHRRWRNTIPALRWAQGGTRHEYVADLSGERQSEKHTLRFQAQTLAADEVTAEFFDDTQVVNNSFTLPGGISVPIGEYDNSGFSASWRSSFIRSYGVNFSYADQNYFGGDRTSTTFGVSARPSPYFNIASNYTREELSLPYGDVKIHVGSADVVLNFSPDLSVNTQIQYDNISETFAISSRMRWELRPETEVFVSLGHGAFIREEKFPEDFRSIQSSAILRFGNRFRF